MMGEAPYDELEVRRLRHDMMNQIHIVVGNLSLLQEDIEGEAAQMAGDAAKAATSLQKLTQELFEKLGIAKPKA